MFEDFGENASGDRRRFGASVIAASVAFGLFATSVVAATSSVTSRAAEEELVQVEFTPPPEPEPEPEPPVPPPPPPPEPEPEAPPAEPRPTPRPAVQRPELVQPDEIEDDELEESDGPLIEDEGSGGPLDGFLDGRRGSTGTGTAPDFDPAPAPPPAPPPRPRGPVMRPENATGGDMVGGMPPIDYPPAARSSGVQGMVIVKCAIDLRGVPQRCSVLRGHPMLNDAALANVQARRFTPVRLPDGTPLEVWKVFPVRFQLTNM